MMNNEDFHNLAPMSIEEKKQVMLDILTAVDLFCSENHIVYSMACGTLLGAVRHKGFIPWDDDIDIYMYRDDYQRFEQVFPEVYQDRYVLHSIFRDEHWNIPFSKVSDNRTAIINNFVNGQRVGVNIDIFPVDDVPDDEVEWQRFHKRQRKMILVNRVRILRVSNCSSLGVLIRALAYKLVYGCNNKRYVGKINHLIMSNNGKGYKRCFESVSGISVKNPFEKRLFDDIVEWPFENRKFKGFGNAMDCLRNTFGDDFMILPPEEERCGHVNETSYWII